MDERTKNDCQTINVNKRRRNRRICNKLPMNMSIEMPKHVNGFVGKRKCADRHKLYGGACILAMTVQCLEMQMQMNGCIWNFDLWHVLYEDEVAPKTPTPILIQPMETATLKLKCLIWIMLLSCLVGVNSQVNDMKNVNWQFKPKTSNSMDRR